MTFLQTREKEMKGLMCPSSASTAVCTGHSPIVPTQVRSRVRGTKYIRLGQQRGIFLAPIRRKISNESQEKKEERTVIQEARVDASSLATSYDDVFQVVVLRVSLHCQGCVGKLKKHLAKMEGVTSFSIDLESKRVTVWGHVSPSCVLDSISKVKKAEFWPLDVQVKGQTQPIRLP